MNRGQLQEINTGIGALLGTGLDSGRRKRKVRDRVSCEHMVLRILPLDIHVREINQQSRPDKEPT